LKTLSCSNFQQYQFFTKAKSDKQTPVIKQKRVLRYQQVALSVAAPHSHKDSLEMGSKMRRD
jgi:hypothetical protein